MVPVPASLLRRPSLLPFQPPPPVVFLAEAADSLTLAGVGLSETYHIRELELSGSPPVPAIEVLVAK